jgi:hypothetical protein
MLFTDESWSQLYRADGRKRVSCRQAVDVNVVNRVPYGGGGVMVWTGISYRQQKLLNFIYGNLNAQIYRDEVLRLIIVPFIHLYNLMFQHVSRIYT